MENIQLDDLSKVCGGAGILGGLLQAAGPVLNGVANIIGASKSGKGAPPQQPGPQAATAAATMGANAGSPQQSLEDSGVSVEVRKL